MTRVFVALLMLSLVAIGQDDEWDTGVGQTEQVTRGLVSYWAMRNGGTTVLDERGITNATAIASPVFSYANGAVANGVAFNGSSQYLKINNTASLGWGTSDGSFSLWFKGTNTANQRLLIKGGFTGGGKRYEAYIFGGNVRAGIDDDITLKEVSVTDDPYVDGNWHHLCFVRDADAFIYLFMNGVNVGSNACSTVGNINQAIPLLIGAGQDELTALSAYFMGAIDEVRIYNVALTSDEIKQLYRMGANPRGIK